MFADYINPYDEFCRQIATMEDNLIFKHLEPYGITQENFNEQKHRITVAVGFDGSRIVAIDHKRAFTVMLVNPKFTSDAGSCKYEITSVVVPF